MTRFKHVKYPKHIMEDVKEFKGINDKPCTDSEIELMTRDEVFEAVTEWDGLINYTRKIKSWVRDIFGVDLDAPETYADEGVREEWTLISKRTGKNIPRIFYSQRDVKDYYDGLSNKSAWDIAKRTVSYSDWSKQ